MKLVIDFDACEGCESCAEMCPDAIEMQNEKAVVTGDACSVCDCDELVGICPVEAISTEE